MEKAGIDVVRIVWSAEYEPLHVEPSADAPGYVRFLAKTKEAEEFWGKVDVTMPPAMARMVAKALIACAEEQERIDGN
jgi:hypothetical protein